MQIAGVCSSIEGFELRPLSFSPSRPLFALTNSWLICWPNKNSGKSANYVAVTIGETIHFSLD